MPVKKLRNAKIQSRVRRSKRLGHQLKQQDRPRLRVYRTPKHIYAQVLKSGDVLVAASTREKDFNSSVTGNIEAARKIGQLLAERAVENGLSEVSFDRAGFKYHGRIKALADAARESGLKF